MNEDAARHIQTIRSTLLASATAVALLGCGDAIAADKPEAAPTIASLTSCDAKDAKEIKVGILAPFSGGGMAADANDLYNAAKFCCRRTKRCGGRLRQGRALQNLVRERGHRGPALGCGDHRRASTYDDARPARNFRALRVDLELRGNSDG